MMQHPLHFHVVLIGSAYRAEEYRLESHIPHDDWNTHVTVVKTVKGLKGTMWSRPEAQVVFLRDWRTQEYAVALYNACLSNGWAQPWRRGLR